MRQAQGNTRLARLLLWSAGYITAMLMFIMGYLGISGHSWLWLLWLLLAVDLPRRAESVPLGAHPRQRAADRRRGHLRRAVRHPGYYRRSKDPSGRANAT